MIIEVVGPLQQLQEVFKAHGQRNAESDGGPQRVPSPDPVPEPKHVGRIDAELCHFGGVRAQRDEMLGDSRRLKIQN
jgi:hypothetical protein